MCTCRPIPKSSEGKQETPGYGTDVHRPYMVTCSIIGLFCVLQECDHSECGLVNVCRVYMHAYPILSHCIIMIYPKLGL